jgi:nicotinamide-nucleotide amidase
MALSEQHQSQLIELAESVGKSLQQHQSYLVTAESCTGGGIAQAITAIAGSSDWFNGGLVTYSNESKSQLLAVDKHLIQAHGAVSQSVVEAMAEGAANIGLGNISVAVSGIAGPGGGTAEKPVGSVWIGWGISDHDRGNAVCSELFVFDGDREEVRFQTIIKALQGVKRLLDR